MKTGINIADLDEETRSRIGIPADPGEGEVPNRLVILGRVLALKGLSLRDGTWVLSQALFAVQNELQAQEKKGFQEAKPPPPGFVLYVVSRAYECLVMDLIGRSRKAHIAEARQVAMFLLWNTEAYTLKAIGEVLGGRTPATITHGFQTIARRSARESGLRNKVEKITIEIGKGETAHSEYMLKGGEKAWI